MLDPGAQEKGATSTRQEGPPTCRVLKRHVRRGAHPTCPHPQQPVVWTGQCPPRTPRPAGAQQCLVPTSSPRDWERQPGPRQVRQADLRLHFRAPSSPRLTHATFGVKCTRHSPWPGDYSLPLPSSADCQATGWDADQADRHLTSMLPPTGL